MRTRSKTIVAAFAITGLTVVGMDAVTYASTGDSLLLGKSNKAGQTTHVTSSGNGAALALHAKGNRAALAVDSNAKIVKLNADRVDGKEAASLQNNVRISTASTATATEIKTFQLPSFPQGRYLATYSVRMNGSGGSEDAPESGYCYLQSDGSPTNAGYAETVSINTPLGLNATDVINKNAASWSLFCSASTAWNISTAYPARVTLTRVDKTIGGPLTVTRQQ